MKNFIVLINVNITFNTQDDGTKCGPNYLNISRFIVGNKHEDSVIITIPTILNISSYFGLILCQTAVQNARNAHQLSFVIIVKRRMRHGQYEQEQLQTSAYQCNLSLREIFPQSMEIIFICSGVTTIWAIGPGKPYGPPTPMGQMGAPRLRL